MCDEIIRPELEAYEYDGCVYCTVDCAAEEFDRDLRDSMSPFPWWDTGNRITEDEYYAAKVAAIKELTPYDILTRADGLRCGDRLRPVAKTMGTMINAAG